MNRSAKAKLLNTDEYPADNQQITKSVSQHGFCKIISWYGSGRMFAICVGFEEQGERFVPLSKKKARIPIIKGFEQDYYLLSSSYLIAEISFNSVITDRWRVVRAF